MTTKLSPYGGLSDRTDRGRRAGLPQHVWVDEVHPGVLIAWQRDGAHWRGQVVWVRGEQGSITIDWLPADRLRRVDPAN